MKVIYSVIIDTGSVNSVHRRKFYNKNTYAPLCGYRISVLPVNHGHLNILVHYLEARDECCFQNPHNWAIAFNMRTPPIEDLGNPRGQVIFRLEILVGK